ncbi:MAG: hypothetical protein LLG16_08525 [Euryarchaeota archaeon]|nr:hypothetical protein [Euryarchaeota archaeon]
MPVKKKVEEEVKEEVPEMEEQENDDLSMDKILNAESSQHLIKAGLEFVQAVEKAVPRRSMPTEVKVHFRNIEKETLLMGRALLDWKIKEIEKKAPVKEKPKAPKVKKIELQ